MEDSSLLLEKSYQIPFQLFKTSFTAFQKKFVYPRTYLTMGLLAAIIGIYAYFVVNGAESQKSLYCMIIIICAALIGFQWYNPRKIRRNLLLAVREIEQDHYRIRIYPEYLEIGTILPPEELAEPSETDDLFDDTPEDNFSGTRIFYNKNLHITEYDDFFMIYQTKTMFYVLPKSAFSEEELEIMRVHFSQRLDKTFQQNSRKI